MRCHYEVLEVPQNADESQIRTAYKKLALRWHPDKNLDDVDTAKTEFQFVQQAYEVLSDRQERAWYDNHREQILRGGNKDFEDNCLDVYQYFTTTCFKGYSDDDGGFYAVYRKVFETIAKEDIEFIDDKEEFCDIPTFGTSSSSYNDVVGPFYSYWLGYSTKKSFVWLDLHKIQDVRERRIYKFMEKENKKIRVKAKQERNEEVRALVSFVRKRDRRVREHAKVEEARILENRRKQEELSQSRRLQRRKELSEMKSEAEWDKFDNVKGQLKEIEKELAKEFGEKLSDDEADSESELLDNSYCAACNKVFKTSKAFQNHEISKKHKENVEKLREYMAEEDETDEEENDDNATEEKVDDEILSDDLTEDEEVEEVKTKKSKRKSKKVMKMNFSVSDHEDVNSPKVNTEEVHDEQESSENLVLTKKQKRKNKKSKASDKNLANGSSADNKNLDKVEIDEEVVEKSKPIKKSKKGAKDLDDIDVAHCCVSCQANFPSKNKLFDHLKKTGHGVQLPQNLKSTKNKKKSKTNSAES